MRDSEASAEDLLQIDQPTFIEPLLDLPLTGLVFFGEFAQFGLLVVGVVVNVQVGPPVNALLHPGDEVGQHRLFLRWGMRPQRSELFTAINRGEVTEQILQTGFPGCEGIAFDVEPDISLAARRQLGHAPASKELSRHRPDWVCLAATRVLHRLQSGLAA